MYNWEHDDRFRAVFKSKQAMDKINYQGLYEDYAAEKLMLPNAPDEDGVVWLKPCESPSGFVAQKTNTIKQLLDDKKDEKIHIGVISNGVHGIDFAERYLSDIIGSIEWKTDKKIMLVYEAPYNNLNCSYGFRMYQKENNEATISDYLNTSYSASTEKCLSSVWWRLDDAEIGEKVDVDNPIRLLAAGRYTSLPLFLIRHCGLINLYMTNLCRYELFEKNKGNEKVLTWRDACQRAEYAIIESAKLFKKEVESFKPDVIFSTANPYNYIWTLQQNKNKKKDYLAYYTIDILGDNNTIPVYKVLHPANPHISSAHRLTVDLCQTIKALVDLNIIESAKAIELFEHYINSSEF